MFYIYVYFSDLYLPKWWFVEKEIKLMLILHRDQKAKNMLKSIDVKEIIQGHSIVTETGIWFYSSNTD
jgi:hypothetical protein